LYVEEKIYLDGKREKISRWTELTLGLIAAVLVRLHARLEDERMRG